MSPVPPPPIVDHSGFVEPRRTVFIVSLDARTVRCRDGAADAASLVRPMANGLVRYGAAPASGSVHSLTFDIGSDGRPASIRGSERSSDGVDLGDLAPSLAASDFGPGRPREGCVVDYVTDVVPVADAPPTLLEEVMSLPDRSRPIDEAYDRVRPPYADCPRAPGQYRRLNLPAFELIPQAPGTISWSFLTFDVDRGGIVRNVRVAGSSGNADLDAAGIRALRRNRYQPGPGYRGCTYHFDKIGTGATPPPELPPGTPADNGEQPGCRLDADAIRRLTDPDTFPGNFARRHIEGIAAIGFDTAPWGAIGDVRVIASEPADAFGDAAVAAIRTSQVYPTGDGRRGCVRRIRFKLPPDPPRPEPVTMPKAGPGDAFRRGEPLPVP